MTGGLFYEGMNDAGASQEPLIVILNDNRDVDIQERWGNLQAFVAGPTETGLFWTEKILQTPYQENPRRADFIPIHPQDQGPASQEPDRNDHL